MSYRSEVLGIFGVALTVPFFRRLMLGALVFIRRAIIHIEIETIRVFQGTHGLIEIGVLGQIQLKESCPGLGIHHGLFYIRLLSRNCIVLSD